MPLIFLPHFLFPSSSLSFFILFLLHSYSFHPFSFPSILLSSNSQSLSPPSSSLAYSLLSASSERDPPSTSGCSSDQSARVKTQKELMKALRELKIHLPAERKGKGKGRSGTLDALKYALNCVKQVRGERGLLATFRWD